MYPLVSEADLRYPIGRYVPSTTSPTSEDRLRALQAIAELPRQFSAAFAGLDAGQVGTPYREGGWTLHQLAHHVADSHMNAYVRLHLALTEDWPTIKPYREAVWAELPYARSVPIDVSLSLLAPLHLRWVALLDSLDQASWRRGYVHPESGRTTVESMTELYSWHGRHHTAHALRLRSRMGW
jgi:hypothetical protein